MIALNVIKIAASPFIGFVMVTEIVPMALMKALQFVKVGSIINVQTPFGAVIYTLVMVVKTLLNFASVQCMSN